ncbi:MAG TPA: GlsB/YeaQ/YmgE family stress response membrane protein [Anaerolineales bacterium]|nr:GlsB/YeaQ/YmgE family stress response membrane protein [Anaerolineales bacterium]
MSLVELVLLLIIAAVIGFIAQSLAGYWRGGLLLAIVLGFVGALVGTWLARRLGLPELLTVSVGGVSFPIVWAIIGAALLVGLVGLVGRGGGGRGGWWGVTPPSRATLTIAILLAVLSLLVTTGILSVSISAYTLMAVAFIILLLGNLVRGL